MTSGTASTRPPTWRPRRWRGPAEDGAWELSYRESGTELPVVFLHGLFADGAVWDPVAARLAGRNRLLSVEAPGHGQTPPRVRPFTLDEEADALATFARDVVGRAAVWVGHSMGGMKALRVALRRSDAVAGLVLVSTDAFAERPSARGPYHALIEVATSTGLTPDLGAAIARLNFGPGFRATAAGAEWAGRFAAVNGPDIAETARSVFDRTDVSAQLPALNVPTLVVHGERDVAVRPERARTFSALIPGARLVVVPDSGHTPPLEQPARVAGLLEEFLDGLGSGR